MYARKIAQSKFYMQEKSPIKKNILQYIEYKGISKYKFYQETGITRGVLDQNNGMSEENTARFIAQYPEVSTDWLLTGKGSMLREQSAPEVAPPPSEPAFPGFIEKIQDLSVKVGRLEAENEHLRAAIEAKQKEIEAQQREIEARQREIEAQRREIEARQKEIEDKERQIKLMRIDHLKKEEPDIHTQYLEPAHTPLPPENPVESAELLKSQPQEALFTP